MARQAARTDGVGGDAEARGIRRRTRLEEDDDDAVEWKMRKWKACRVRVCAVTEIAALT